MNPAYLQVRFIWDQNIRLIPDEFFIITAYNPMDEILDESENVFRNQVLGRMIKSSGASCLPIIGASHDLLHQEASFLTNATEDLVMDWSRFFDQRAIYRVKGDDLILLSCIDMKEQPLGLFRERLISPDNRFSE